jgi:hypothetical protein
MNNLSEHFTFLELTRSDYAIRNGIDNTPNNQQAEELKLLCQHILEPVRALFGLPIIITSGFRNERVNSAIGGSRTSQHMKGQAADFHVHGLDNLTAMREIMSERPIQYDQIIYEFGQDGWIHISRSNSLRREALSASLRNGKTLYQPFAMFDAPLDVS